MGKAFIQDTTLTSIANAIRTKNGSSNTYLPSQMPQAILNIPSGGGGVQYNVLCFTAVQANSSIYIRCHTDLHVTLQYSYDNSTWNNWTSSVSGSNDVFSTITLSNIGDKVYIRGNNATMGRSTSIYSQFVMTGKIAASGSIQSLLTYEGMALHIPRSYCYYQIFYRCTALTTAPALPATILKDNCYREMFSGCNSLTTAPALPATTLLSYCYYSMFQDCTALTTAPALPATTLVSNCYRQMFYGCTALTTAPALLATTLVSNCYYRMFYKCNHLNYIKVGATTWNTSYANNWVSNVASSGTFVKPSGTTIATGTSGVPSGWTVQNI